MASKVWVKRPAHWAQHVAVVDVAYTRPGKRKPNFVTLVPNNIEYCTIETADGSVLYDSRTEVPCDMATFVAKAANPAWPAGSVVSHRVAG